MFGLPSFRFGHAGLTIVPLYQRIVLTKTYVVLMTPTAIRLWDILRLNFGRGLDSKSPEPIEEHFSITPPWAQLPRLHLITTLRIPHLNTCPDSLLLSVLYFIEQDSGRTMRVILYELVIKPKRGSVGEDGSFDGYEATVRPLTSGELPSSRCLPCGEPSAGLWVMGPCSPQGVFRSFAPRFPFDTERASLHTATESLTEGGAPEPVTLVPLMRAYPVASCPFSGRVLYRTEFLQSEGQPVLCVDYLS